MRGIFLSILILGIIVAGCAQPEPTGNETNQSNQTNTTPPAQNCTGPVCGSDNLTYATDCESDIANVSILYTGECVVIEENCTDSDNGSDPSILGTAIKGDEQKSDFCLNESALVEYLCLDNAIENITLPCAEKKECKEGACVQKPEVIPNATCDGPLEPDIYSRANVSFNSTSYLDYCIEYKMVKDYFCKDNALQSMNNECPPGFGCKDGICYLLTLECSDSDGGKNLSARGKVVVLKGVVSVFEGTDECADSGKVGEYSCLENGTYAFDDILCPSGTKCASGRCVKSDCKDTDNGIDIYKGGTVSASGSSEDDMCMDDYTVREYYCYGDESRHDDIRCPRKHICNFDTGSCVEGSID